MELINESIILGTKGSGLFTVPGIKEGVGVGDGIAKGLLMRFVGRGVGVLLVVLVIVGEGVGVGEEEPPPPEVDVPAVAVTEFDEEPDPDPLTALINTV